jgi:hypothetical protein
VFYRILTGSLTWGGDLETIESHCTGVVIWTILSKLNMSTTAFNIHASVSSTFNVEIELILSVAKGLRVFEKTWDVGKFLRKAREQNVRNRSERDLECIEEDRLSFRHKYHLTKTNQRSLTTS